MLSIFEKWTNCEKKIVESYANNNVYVLEDDGFLPENIESPYRYYVSKYGYKSSNPSPLFADLLEISELWDIDMSFEKAEIWDAGIKKAEIEYAEPIEFHNVKSVSWMLPNGVVYKKDNYDTYGKLYFTELYAEDGSLDVRIYLSAEKKPVIIYQPKFDLYTLMYGGKVIARLDSKQEFLVHFVNNEFATEEAILFNSVDLAQSLQDVNILNKKILIQGKIDNLSMYQKLFERTDISLLFDSEAEIIRWKDLLKISCKQFHYSVKSFHENSFGNEILILTNSDRIEQIEKIVQELQAFKFHIGAKTRMSNKLLALRQYENVSLYEGISESKRVELLEKCSYYLDINHYDEICDAVYEAYRYNLLIVGFDITIHDKSYILPENIFDVSDIDAMIAYLKKLRIKKPILHEQLLRQNKLCNYS